jgi:hypothetical protein
MYTGHRAVRVECTGQYVTSQGLHYLDWFLRILYSSARQKLPEEGLECSEDSVPSGSNCARMLWIKQTSHAALKFYMARTSFCLGNHAGFIIIIQEPRFFRNIVFCYVCAQPSCSSSMTWWHAKFLAWKLSACQWTCYSSGTYFYQYICPSLCLLQPFQIPARFIQ